MAFEAADFLVRWKGNRDEHFLERMPAWLRRRTVSLAFEVSVLVLLAAACPASSHTTATNPSSTSAKNPPPTSGQPGTTAGSSRCTKIGVLLPNTTDQRWMAQDQPLLARLIPNGTPGAQVLFANAGGDPATQLSQANTDLADGDCLLMVAPVDPTAAAQIVSAATTRKVPVIAYAVPIESKATSYFVGFDQGKVGQLQGQYIADHYQAYPPGRGDAVAMIAGAATNSLARLQHQGAANVLQPLFDNKTLKKVFDQFTPNSDPATAGNEISGALVQNGNNVQIANVGDDAMAGAVIAAVNAQRLGGRVLITGAGATVSALQHILVGDQTMTVETNPALQAQDAAKLIAVVADGTSATPLLNGSVSTSDGGSVPAVLEAPVAVDRTNIAQTVLADGSVTKTQLCSGLPAGTNSNGICP